VCHPDAVSRSFVLEFGDIRRERETRASFFRVPETYRDWIPWTRKNVPGLRDSKAEESDMKPAPRAVAPTEARPNRDCRSSRRRPRGGGRPAVEAARDARLMELLPQVRYIARRIHSRLPGHVPFEDLVQAGVLGLLDALRKFDPRRKVQLESYMKFRIRGAVLDELRSLDWSPRELRRRARRLEEVEHQLRSRLGRDGSAPELAEALGVSLEQFHRLVRELRGLEVGSLQEIAMATDDGVEQDRASRLAAPEAYSPLTLYAESERRARLEQAIRELPESEKLVLTLHYYEELTMKEVGEVLSVGESRVSQIHSMALGRLLKCLGTGVPEGFSSQKAAVEGRGELGRAWAD
jgi:RNA polymerase sigma factor for flagellar operon FliA